MAARVTTGRMAVITGLGVVAGPDCGLDAVDRSLRAGILHTTAVDDSQGYHLPGRSRQAVQTRGVDLSRWLPPSARRMSPPSRLAVAAARMAREQAGLPPTSGDDRMAVVMSSSFGAVTSTEDLLSTARRLGPQAVSPFSFAESVANAAAGQVAIDAKAHGANLTVVQRETGVLTAMGRGSELITSGRADRVLAGNVDEMPPILHALLGHFDALAPPDEQGVETPRPFDKRRSGFVVAEGAVVAVLEDAEAARARGAIAIATIIAFGSGFDATAPRIGWGRGERVLGAAIARTLTNAGIEIDDVSRIVTGACGAIDGDRLEGLMLRHAWSDRALPLVFAPRSCVGQYGGGFLAAAVLLTGSGEFAGTPGFAEPDPQIGLTPFTGGHLAPAPLSLITTAGSGGSAAWLVLKRP